MVSNDAVYPPKNYRPARRAVFSLERKYHPVAQGRAPAYEDQAATVRLVTEVSRMKTVLLKTQPAAKEVDGVILSQRAEPDGLKVRQVYKASGLGGGMGPKEFKGEAVSLAWATLVLAE
jgi:hypothetical protein